MKNKWLKIRISEEELSVLKNAQKKSEHETFSAFIRFLIRKLVNSFK